jgi:hypothetical protein
MGKIFKKNKIKINFINCNSQNKQNGPKVFNTNEIALEELKAKELIKWKYKQKHQILVESLAGLGFSERI